MQIANLSSPSEHTNRQPADEVREPHPKRRRGGLHMKNDLTSQLLLLAAGAIAGIFSGAIGAYYKASLDRKSELKKSEAAIRIQYLYPILMIAVELRAKLVHIMGVLQKEKDDTRPEPEMNDPNDYRLRFWFWQCKEYVTESKFGETAEDRKRQLAMHSGGAGYDAVSSLYITASYLWHATRIRLRIPSDLEGRGIELLQHLDRVRDSLEVLEFYDVAQDSTGASVTSKTGDVMNYREFCEAMTSDAERAWFLTLCDVYFKLYRRSLEDVHQVDVSLAALIVFVRDVLALDKHEFMRSRSIKSQIGQTL
jgi:hypothetical protein